VTSPQAPAAIGARTPDGATVALRARGLSKPTYLVRLGYNRSVLTYQPASRFWPLQWVETGILTAVAVLLVRFCYWRIRHAKVS
jgi:hypothetical protein